MDGVERTVTIACGGRGASAGPTSFRLEEDPGVQAAMDEQMEAAAPVGAGAFAPLPGTRQLERQGLR
jgi:hypothetical protein